MRLVQRHRVDGRLARDLVGEPVRRSVPGCKHDRKRRAGVVIQIGDRTGRDQVRRSPLGRSVADRARDPREVPHQWACHHRQQQQGHGCHRRRRRWSAEAAIAVKGPHRQPEPRPRWRASLSADRAPSAPTRRDAGTAATRLPAAPRPPQPPRVLERHRRPVRSRSPTAPTHGVSAAGPTAAATTIADRYIQGSAFQNRSTCPPAIPAVSTAPTPGLATRAIIAAISAAGEMPAGSRPEEDHDRRAAGPAEAPPDGRGSPGPSLPASVRRG